MMKKINLFYILLVINLISTIQIPCLEEYVSNITTIYLSLNIISFILMLILRPRIKLKGFLKFISFYYLILFISMVINNASFKTLIIEAITTLTTMLIWNSLDKDEFLNSINISIFALEILTYLNFIIILLYPNGLYNIGLGRKYYLFGQINITIRYLLPGLCFMLIRNYEKGIKMDFRSVSYFIVIGLTLVLTQPTTAILGFVIFIISMILMNKFKNIQGFLTPIKTITASAIISFLIIKVNIQNYFANFILNVLHKDLTFTGRMGIWNSALESISKHYFLGHGRLSIESRVSILGASSAHNEFLILQFEGGIILLLLIFIMMLIISLKLEKCNNTKIKIVLFATMLSYFVMWISEPFSYSGTALMFLIWLIAYHSPKLFGKNEN